MEKHPIDDLFREKLSGFERQPTHKAWERLEQRSQKSRRSIGWLWYAAAGVVVTLLAGYMVWENDHKAQQPALAQKTDQVTPRKPIDVPRGEESVPAEAAIVPNPETVAWQKKAVSEPKRQRDAVTVPEKADVVSEQVVVIPVEPVTKPIEMQESERVVIAAVTSSDKVKKMPAVRKQDENRTIIVQVDPLTEPVDEKAKSTRLGKIFRQLKNVKEGEPVDWKDMGFNPKTVVARVDNRLRQGEEKLSEKYQDIKERTKF